MTKVKTIWTTPAGQFSSVIAACKVLQCDRTTLYGRVERGVEGYAKTDIVPEPRAPRSKLPSWSEYRVLPFEQRESIFQAWCKKRRLEQDSEHTVNAFFDAMDSVEDTSESA